MPIQTQATVSDLVTEMNGTGAGPYTIFDNGGITSGQIYDKIREANVVLQGWTGIGGTSGDAVGNEQIRRFESNYASALLAASLIGIITIDGFNYTMGGLSVQRESAKIQTYEAFIKAKLQVSQYYIKMLHQWFFPYNPTNPTGYTEQGVPVTYWGVSAPRYG